MLFEIHDTLNPVLWDDNNQLKPEIREALLKCAEEFKNNLEVDFKILDVQLVGSNAAYNYTANSDIDLHVVANFDSVECSQDILRLLFNLYQSKFKSSYPITIKGLNVEIYVEDTHSTALSNGRYSVTSDKWIKFPSRIEAPTYDTTKAVNSYISQIDAAIGASDENKLEQLNDELHLKRHQSIASSGEYSFDNQVFKELRDRGYIEKMKTAIKTIKTKQLTLEGLKMSKKFVPREWSKRPMSATGLHEGYENSEGVYYYEIYFDGNLIERSADKFEDDTDAYTAGYSRCRDIIHSDRYADLADDYYSPEEEIIDNNFDVVTCKESLDETGVLVESIPYDSRIFETTYDEVLSSMIDNASDADIDNTLTTFENFAKELGVDPEDMAIYVLPSGDCYPYTEFDDEFNGKTETVSGNIWLYFANEEDAEHWFRHCKEKEFSGICESLEKPEGSAIMEDCYTTYVKSCPNHKQGVIDDWALRYTACMHRMKADKIKNYINDKEMVNENHK